MSKIIITEEEKQEILSKYFSQKTINEGRGLMQLFGNYADDVVKSFGLADDAVKSLDDVLGKAFANTRNIIRRGADTFFKSASGAEVSTKLVSDVIELVSQGKLLPDALNRLPRNLVDGTEFRSIIDKALKSKKVPQVTQKFPPTKPMVKPTAGEYQKQVSQAYSKYGAGSN